MLDRPQILKEDRICATGNWLRSETTGAASGPTQVPAMRYRDATTASWCESAGMISGNIARRQRLGCR